MGNLVTIGIKLFLKLFSGGFLDVLGKVGASNWFMLVGGLSGCLI